MMTFGSLFSGIGGIDLGLERAGMACAWQVEIDDYATRVLAKHWSNVPRHRDVRLVGAHNLPAVDLIAGGFPCQPHALVGKRRGANDDRNLWPEFIRIICELRPRWVLAENVPGLLSTDDGRFFGAILRDLAESGYDAEWSIVSACSMGAPHPRERLFLVAYPCSSVGETGLRIREYGPSATLSPADTITAEVLRLESAHRDRGGFNGLPRELDRFRGLGNAVVPAVAEFVGRQIVAHWEHHHG